MHHVMQTGHVTLDLGVASSSYLHRSVVRYEFLLQVLIPQTPVSEVLQKVMVHDLHQCGREKRGK